MNAYDRLMNPVYACVYHPLPKKPPPDFGEDLSVTDSIGTKLAILQKRTGHAL